MKIIFLGPPGSGKGTLAKKLSETSGFFHVAAGDLLREEVFRGSELSEKINEFLKKGVLVPDKIVVELIKNKIIQNNGFLHNFIIDGFPRNLAQAKELEGMLLEMNSKIDGVIYFQLSEDQAVERLSGRLSCPKCGAVYHLKNMPPKKDNLCDNCGSRLFIREDDVPETIKKRYEIYEDQTKPLIDYYSQKKLLYDLDAAGGVNEIYQRLMKVINQVYHDHT